MNILSSDSHVEVGATHDLCEDYAVSSDRAIIVCDGCSSSPNTDFGAQVLARACLRNIKMSANTVESVKIAIECSIHAALAASKVLDIPNTCLDATIVAGVPIGEEFHFFLVGDGVLAWKYKDAEKPQFLIVDYVNNAPEYLSYGLDVHRREKYLAEFGNERIVKGNNGIVDVLNGQIIATFCPLSSEGLEWVAVFTDGVSSFQGVETQEVLSHLTAFKNFKGKFLKRRAKRYLNTQGLRHDDDVSCAAMSFSTGE